MPASNSNDDDILIPLSSLRRLDLKPGETLLVTAPEGIVSPDQVASFSAKLKQFLVDRHPDLEVVVVPSGTEVDIVSGEQQ